MGKCKLTGREGKFVKSHIIPKALTRPSVPGSKFIQKNAGNGPNAYIRRSDSWYDSSIVTREGENYLAALDAHAIEELRNFGLLWSSSSIRKQPIAGKNELILINFASPQKMRLFFLSLLWRASISTLPEFQNVQLPADKLEQLRQIIIGEKEDDLRFFPVAIIALTNKGPIHIQSPEKQRFGPKGLEIIRFYMDGLIAHIHLEDPKLAVLQNPLPWDHPMFLGHEKTIVTQIETSQSIQLSELTEESLEYRDFLNNLNCGSLLTDGKYIQTNSVKFSD